MGKNQKKEQKKETQSRSDQKAEKQQQKMQAQKEKEYKKQLKEEEKQKKIKQRDQKANEKKEKREDVIKKKSEIKRLYEEKNNITREISKREESSRNALREAQACLKSMKEAQDPEAQRRWKEKAECAYDFHQEQMGAAERMRTKSSEIDDDINSMKYSLFQKRRAFLETLNRTEGFLARLWKRLPIYVIYRAIADKVNETRAKTSHTDLIEQYAKVRKAQDVDLATKRLEFDASKHVDKYLNNEKASELDKIEKLAQICGRSKATIVAQLNDKEVLQFKFVPRSLDLKEGDIEITKRLIQQNEKGEVSLGKEELQGIMKFENKMIEGLSQQKSDQLIMKIYHGHIVPDKKTSLLQVPDDEITVAVRKEREEELQTAMARPLYKEEKSNEQKVDKSWGVMQESSENVPAVAERDSGTEKGEEQASVVQEAKTQVQMQTKADDHFYHKLTDLEYGRIDITKASAEEKAQIKKDMVYQITHMPREETSENKEKLTLNSEQALFNKLMRKDVCYSPQVIENETVKKPAVLYDRATGKEIEITVGKETKPLTMGYIKSEQFLTNVFNNIQARNTKNEERIGDLLAGKPFPEGSKNYEGQVSESLRNTILRTGDAIEVNKEAAPVTVSSNRELVEKIKNGEVLFGNDISEEGKANRLLVDRDTGAQLVQTDKDGQTQALTEHDFCAKTFSREVQQESAKIMEERAAEQTAEQNVSEPETQTDQPNGQDHVEQENDCQTLQEAMQSMYSKEDEQEILRQTVTIDDDGYLRDDNDQPVCINNEQINMHDISKDSDLYRALESKQEKATLLVYDQEPAQDVGQPANEMQDDFNEAKIDRDSLDEQSYHDSGSDCVGNEAICNHIDQNQDEHDDWSNNDEH